MKTGHVTTAYRISERTRLSEFSLLLHTLGIEPSEFWFVSLEAHGGFFSDIETIRTVTSRVDRRDERVVFAHLPSFKNYFPQSFFVEQLEESDHHPGILEDRYLEFWSAFDTLTYRHWIAHHLLRLRMLFCIEDNDTELLYWETLGGDLPTLSREDRKYLLLLRFFSPYFLGRRLLYEQVLPAFLRKPVTVEENMTAVETIPEEFQSRLGKVNSYLGRDLYPGAEFEENFSTFCVTVSGLEADDIADFTHGGRLRTITNNLLTLFRPSHLRSELRFLFQPGLSIFVIGDESRSAFLGFSTHLRETM